MNNSQIFTLIVASSFFGFLVGFNSGIRYKIDIQVKYHNIPDTYGPEDLPQIMLKDEGKNL